MFDAVLVANRGEIALRILRACRELGVTTIGVFSDVDRGAPWLRVADESHLLGAGAPAESYLNVERILDVAAATGAQAIHPGYGFLSENADFARAVTDAGLVWIGPPPDAIVAMGDKLSARAAAQAAGVPVVPGTMEPTRDLGVVEAFAEEHGLPVAIKAAFGGGGRGLKVVRKARELADALEAAEREAVASFGRGEVYVERYLSRPRHIEAQVLADMHGTCLFLGERDCSTQRRHQKLIEEAPAVHLPDDVRAAIGECAVSVSEQVGYTGAGTVEFLYEDGDFYFLEMNTRLQVEHPVTEIVTGIDLVHWQLRVAAGEKLPWAQDDIGVRGHAIEARINAEHVAANFTPAPGLITSWMPASGPGIRVDGGVETGWEIPRTYDSLIAKLIAHGADREEARRKLLRACEEFVIEGVPTTLDFHRMALGHPDFVDGRVSTISVEREWDLSGIPNAPAATEGPGAQEPTRTVTVEVNGKRMEVAVFEPASVRPRRRRSGSAAAGTAAESHGPDLVAPMQGTIVKVALDVGATVNAGDPVVVLEAMKMENMIAAHRAGVITDVAVAAGDPVNTGDVLATIQKAGAGEGAGEDQ